MSDTIHASVARVGGKGVLIRGRSGSGKSSLLLALLSSPDAILVADDRAHLSLSNGRVIATVPESIAGQMEVRGVGIVRRQFVSSAPVDLVVDLLPLEECPRMPFGDEAWERLLGVAVPRICVAIGAHDGEARVRAALSRSKPEILV
jgi:serine kinase of HPr protein (carbohydrate metabolism regulator)